LEYKKLWNVEIGIKYLYLVLKSICRTFNLSNRKIALALAPLYIKIVPKVSCLVLDLVDFPDFWGLERVCAVK
jgi:hypothetical protein